MLFNSLEFLIFFPIVVIIYFLLPHKYRWGILLIASYYFYMAWKPEYILLIVLSTVIDYFASIQMAKYESKKKKQLFLLLSLLTNLGILILFKYYNFLIQPVSQFIIKFNIKYSIPNFSLLLPMGISFYTFQTLSYTIDVYRGVIKPEKHFGVFALYVSFFPQLVAGPIERSRNLLPQFYKEHSFDYVRITDGLKRMLLGFFKKIVIADNLAIVVNQVYNNPSEYKNIQLILATVFFAFQILCDFSGYTDIAIGAAKVLGFDLMENFKRPYFSKSIAEFWKRWHISLSSWFKDYLYIPLGGNRVKIPRYYLNLLLTFMISGLWHGAKWTFLIWGMLHGIYLISSIITKKLRNRIVQTSKINTHPKIHNLLKVIFTFSLVTFAWIFFRAYDLNHTLYIIKNIFIGWTDVFKNGLYVSIIKMGINPLHLILCVFLIVILILIDLMSRKDSIIDIVNSKPIVIRWAIYLIILLLILFFGNFNVSEFIYFQF